MHSPAALRTLEPFLSARPRDTAHARCAQVGAVKATWHAPEAVGRRYAYELLDTPAGIRLLFGDVTAEPAHAAAAARGMVDAFRAEAPRAPDTVELSHRVATSLHDEYADEHAHGHRLLARLMLVEYGPGRSLTLVNRGCSAPLLLAHHRTRVLEPPLRTPPVGILAPGSLRPPPLKLAAYPGDRLLLPALSDDGMWHMGAPAPAESHLAVGGGDGDGAWCLVEFLGPG